MEHVIWLIWVALMILVLAGGWKMFTKAGKPGWAIIIPIYNLIVMLEIAGKPIWWVILFFIPLVNIVVSVLMSIAIAENFGQGAGFGIGIWLLPFIFVPILGFGSAKYLAGDEPAAAPPTPERQPAE